MDKKIEAGLCWGQASPRFNFDSVSKGEQGCTIVAVHVPGLRQDVSPR